MLENKELGWENIEVSQKVEGDIYRVEEDIGAERGRVKLKRKIEGGVD